jgi:hypothetical protein
MLTKKVPQFICNCCNYSTIRKSQYNRHILTTKHNTLYKKNEETDPNKYVCDVCNKNYKSRVGLWGHKKTCGVEDSQQQDTQENNETDIIVELVKQHTDFQQLLIDQNKIIIDQNQQLIKLSSNQSITTTTINNIHTIHKNKFNLNFFLNEKCKDALNITDFVKTLELKLTDLENTGKNGFVEGISQIFIRGLKELDIYKRPIHCSDIKRETMYVKDKDIWEKENEEKEKINNTIRQIAYNNVNQISGWIKENPQSIESDSCKNDLYLKILNESMGGVSDEENTKYYNKIVKNISKEVTITSII